MDQNTIKTKAKDITYQKFGRLTVISRAENDKYGNANWNCICECGNTKVVKGAELRSGLVKSCGCFHKEIVSKLSKKHGLINHRLYSIWNNMKARCYNPKNPHFDCYGARGIIICDQWLNNNGFINFYNWAINNGYKDDLTIDRIDNNGNYEPLNCRWVTRKMQAQNRRNTILVKYNNEIMTITTVAQITHKNWKTIKKQVEKGEIHRVF